MKLSIIIPIYNEENHIEKVVDLLFKLKLLIEKEIILVDDGSKDKTRVKLKKLKKKYPMLRQILLKKNYGKGYAIRKGLGKFTGDLVLIQDADLEYKIEEIPKIIKPLISGKEKVVYGSRFLGKISGMRWQNRLANKILTTTVNFFYWSKITDEATAYKAFDRGVIKSINLKCKRFEFCPEVTAKVLKKKIKIKEIPISYTARDVKAGKKIKLKDAFEAFWTLIKYRFKD